jgi:hypothetical protein
MEATSWARARNIDMLALTMQLPKFMKFRANSILFHISHLL